MSFTAHAANYAIIKIMSEPFVFLGNMPAPTGKEKAKTKQIIAEARAAGHPWAWVAGSLPDDEVTREWIKAMQENRRKADENPKLFGGL